MDLAFHLDLVKLICLFIKIVIQMNLTNVLMVAVLQCVPARTQLPDGHEEGHDHALRDPLHWVQVVIYFSHS